MALQVNKLINIALKRKTARSQVIALYAVLNDLQTLDRATLAVGRYTIAANRILKDFKRNQEKFKLIKAVLDLSDSLVKRGVGIEQESSFRLNKVAARFLKTITLVSRNNSPLAVKKPKPKDS